MTTLWNTYYVGTEQEILTALSQIDSNCGFPDGYTDTWAMPIQAFNQDFWFFIKPPPGGYMEPTRSFTQEEMIAGVVNVVEEESQPSWWPVVPPEEL